MVSHSLSVIRSKLDAIRASATSLGDVEKHIDTDLEDFLRSHGLLDEGGQTRSHTHMEQPVSNHCDRVVYSCPWQTCQATRLTLES